MSNTTAQKGVEESKYHTLKSNLKHPTNAFQCSRPSLAYLKAIMSSKTVSMFEKNLRCLPADADGNLFLIQDLMFALLALFNNKPDMTAEEKNYADNFLKLIFEGISGYAGEQWIYENREAQLTSINNILKQRGLIKNSSEGYKADGILTYAGNEVLLAEICGPFMNRSRSKVQFDRHKGLYGMLAMLRGVASKYYYGSVSTFEKLKLLFVHTKENEIQLWCMSFSHDVFYFQRLSVCILTNDFKLKTETISNLLKFVASVQACLKDVETVIDQLCNEHDHINAAITLGMSNPHNATNLKEIVNPTIRHLNEKRDSTGLFIEDPVSFSEDLKEFDSAYHT